MKNIEIIENEIITILKNTLPEIRVESFPDNVSNFTLLNAKGAVLVHFQGFAGTPLSFANFEDTKIKYEFGLTIILRNLKSPKGIYQVIKNIYDSTNLVSIDNMFLRCQTGEFISKENDLWIYGVSIFLEE